MATRPPLVQKMLDSVKKQGDYRDDVPKEWMNSDYGMEYALVKYVEDLETQLAKKTRAIAKKPKSTKR